MPYSTPTLVRTVIDTNLTEDKIEDLIELADEEIDNRGITLNRKVVSMLFTAALASMNDTRSRGAGEYSGNVSTYEKWRDHAEKIIGGGVASSGGGSAEPAILVWNDPLPSET